MALEERDTAPDRHDGSSNNDNADGNSSSKPKRVRTGCLTCRERHLKCDEGQPICQNCRKSSRTCRRGVRLNFMYIDCKEPPVLLSSDDWAVGFEDNSREIASEYKGGLQRYALPEEQVHPLSAVDNSVSYDFAEDPTSTAATAHPPPAPTLMPGTLPDNIDAGGFSSRPQSYHNHSASHSDSGYGSNYPITGSTSYSNAESPSSSSKLSRAYLSNPDELMYLQIFIEEVGLWMDSLDPHKHFSRLLPFHALHEPMLLNAFLACGARHISLVNPKHSEDRALRYYDEATSRLMTAMEHAERNTVMCAITAVILNVYEIMCERALQRMNHIAGARALIKECGWNAKSTGIGAACFWLNVGMELLSCLHFNWKVAWDPDDWGLDIDFKSEPAGGREEVWTHRIIYINGRVANFRANASVEAREQSPRAEQLRLQHRYAEWSQLRQWAETWDDNVPSTMHPLAYLEPEQTSSDSVFPEVYVIKRTNIIARLFYHTAMVLLAQTNPYLANELGEMQQMQHTHSTLICGIVAHTKDRGVASVAIRSLAIAAECLTDIRAQEEVLRIFERIRKHTGFRVGFVHTELPRKWGWAEPAEEGSNTATVNQQTNSTHGPQQSQQPQQQPQQFTGHSGLQTAQQFAMHADADPVPTPPSLQPFHPHAWLGTDTRSQHHQNAQQVPPQVSMPQQHHQRTHSSQAQSQTPQRPTGMPPAGIVNPLLSNADFGLPSHPYQDHYVEPAIDNIPTGLQLGDTALGHNSVPPPSMQGLNGFTY